MNGLTEERKNEISGIITIALGIILALSLTGRGVGEAGEVLRVFFVSILGWGSYSVPLILLFIGYRLIKEKTIGLNVRWAGFSLFFICTVILMHWSISKELSFQQGLEGVGGGLLGHFLAFFIKEWFGPVGGLIIVLAFLVIGILLWFDILLENLLGLFRGCLRALKVKLAGLKKFIPWKKRKKEENEEEEIRALPPGRDDIDDEIVIGEEADDVQKDKVTRESSNQKGDGFCFPSLKLLNKIREGKKAPEDQSETLKNTLANFGVEANVLKVTHGPTITRYELQPQPGVKVSKIVNLADDIALALAAPEVRIEAPIPGKAAVGIEIPHKANSLVTLREILESAEYRNTRHIIPVSLGKDVAGEPVVVDLTKMPHLLVAGATGTGKSVFINSLILSIIYNAHPDQVKLLLIDPKKVELALYDNLPHLMAPVVTDTKKAAAVLNLVVEEMEKRYELFSEVGARNIESYNRIVQKNIDSEEEEVDHRLPYVVLIIDELSDLMMVSPNEVEDAICRLAQMARAAGIHLVLATQRPSVDVITGLIKANIPSRISFAVSSQTDSRTILDMNGAEKLLGNGDMLFAPVGSLKPKRIQGAFVSNREIKRVVDFLKGEGKQQYELDLEQIDDLPSNISREEEKDDLYQEAVRLIVENNRASISMLQRRFRIGYTRAARLIDMMEEDGIVGPYAGSKPRDVLVSKEDLSRIFQAGDKEDA